MWINGRIAKVMQNARKKPTTLNEKWGLDIQSIAPSV